MRTPCVALLLLLSPVALADGGKLRGSVGAGAGFGVVSGRSLIVDSVSGASTKDNVDTFTRGVFVSGVTVDLGLYAAGAGDLGLHLAIDGSTPGPYFAAAFLPRYRWELGRFEPWIGAGFGVETSDGDPFFGFPVAGGCALRLGFGALITAEAAMTMINPWGPSRSAMVDDTMRELEDHLDRFVVKLGLAWPLY